MCGLDALGNAYGKLFDALFDAACAVACLPVIVAVIMIAYNSWNFIKYNVYVKSANKTAENHAMGSVKIEDLIAEQTQRLEKLKEQRTELQTLKVQCVAWLLFMILTAIGYMMISFFFFWAFFCFFCLASLFSDMAFIITRVFWIDRDGVVAAVNWLTPLVDASMDRLRQYHNVGETAALPGAKVVAMVCAHIRGVFREHRKALEDNVDYCCRSRDPPQRPKS